MEHDLLTSSIGPESPRSAWRSRWELACLAICTVALLAPFLDKPFNIDDPLFVWAAKNIQKTPLNFFGFDVNWNGEFQKMYDVTQNPPLACYYLAGAAALTGGWSERWLHAACLLPAVGTVLGTWLLAGKFCRRPMLAGLAVVCSPIFLVSGTNVMCDVLMTCLWMGAIVLWHSGLERDSHWRMATAALLVGAAALTKYFGLCLLPLLGLYTVVRKGRLDLRLLWLLIPVACLAGYEAWTHHLYGHGLVSGASHFVRSRYFGKSPDPSGKWIATFAFTGGCLVCLPFFLPRLLRKHWLWLVLAATTIGLTILFHSWNPISLQPGKSRPTTWDLTFQAALLVMLGGGVLFLTLRDVWHAVKDSRDAAPDLRRRTRAEALLLASWVTGTMIFAGFVNWTVNGRSVLPLVPAAAILLCRALDRVPFVAASPVGLRAWWTRCLWSNPQSPWPALLLLPAAVLALLVTQADFRFARTQQEAAKKIMAVGRPPRTLVWFAGHWGFQYSMEQLGGIAMEYPADPLEPGDMFALPLNNDTQYSLPPGGELVKVIKLDLSPWASTNLPARCAGFYNSEGGTLPFVFGSEWQSDPQYAEAVRENGRDVYILSRIRQPVTMFPKWMAQPGNPQEREQPD